MRKVIKGAYEIISKSNFLWILLIVFFIPGNVNPSWGELRSSLPCEDTTGKFGGSVAKFGAWEVCKEVDLRRGGVNKLLVSEIKYFLIDGYYKTPVRIIARGGSFAIETELDLSKFGSLFWVDNNSPLNTSITSESIATGVDGLKGIKQFKKGKTARVVFALPHSRVTLEFSLKGFTKAYNLLKEDTWMLCEARDEIAQDTIWCLKSKKKHYSNTYSLALDSKLLSTQIYVLGKGVYLKTDEELTNSNRLVAKVDLNKSIRLKRLSENLYKLVGDDVIGQFKKGVTLGVLVKPGLFAKEVEFSLLGFGEIYSSIINNVTHKAAKAGDVEAQTSLGRMYYQTFPD